MAQREHETNDWPAEWRIRTYDRWVAAQGAPVIDGLYIPDLRTASIGPWESKGAKRSVTVSAVHLAGA